MGGQIPLADNDSYLTIATKCPPIMDLFLFQRDLLF